MSARIVGVGLDLVELARLSDILDRHQRRFLNRICRPGEVLRHSGTVAFVQHVGGLFAAKEAVLKALGTGWGRGAAFRDVEIVRCAADQGPAVRLHDGALRRARDLGVVRVHVSITHERGHAAAVAVLES
ncbi:MAG TPA: holo-ACP synthase [Thermoanaerobaculia bacterium]|nr:holo-ACP synthase [Thermoanaerobaculia bacterium]